MKPIRFKPSDVFVAATLVLLWAFAAPPARAELSITTDATLPVALTDVSYWQPIGATGGVEPYTWEIVDPDEWPEWLDRDYIDHWTDWGYDCPYLYGWPSSYYIATYTFVLRVTDAEGAIVEKTFTLEVQENPNHPPVIDRRIPADDECVIATNETIVLSFSAHDPDGDPLTYSWYGYWDDEEGRHDLGIDCNDSSFAFSRGAGEVGTFFVQCTISDGMFPRWENWCVTVKNLPVIETEALPDATEEVPYSATLSAHGGTPPYSWSVLPSGYVETSQASTFAETGTAQGWNGAWESWPLDLPFPFPFLSKFYSSVQVSSDGYISMGNVQINVLRSSMSTENADTDIFVDSGDDHVTIRWKAIYYWGGDEVNASATLYPDGKIVLAYGNGNSDNGWAGDIGIRKGPWDNQTQQYEYELFSEKSGSSSMANAADVVFVPQFDVPDGLSLGTNGVLSGTPHEPGEYTIAVGVMDSARETRTKTVALRIETNESIRPSFTAVSPIPGYVNLGGSQTQTFTAVATHPSGGTVRFQWFVDGELAGTGGTFEYEAPDTDLHEVRCAAGGEGLAKTATRDWTVGTLHFAVDPEDVEISFGKNLVLDASEWFVSSLPAKVTWFRAVWDENDPGPWDVEIGSGPRLVLENVSETRKYYAQVENELGRIRSRVFKVVVDPSPAVGRVYKLTGAPFVGNRLVLRAKTWGDPAEASFAWKRNGTTVATTERLDIPALTASDFGTYTLTMTNPHGSATTEPFVLDEAKSGVPVGWGASDHGRTEAPEGDSGLVQVASGMNFNLGLKADGTVTAWGFNEHGGCDVPDGLSDVSSVAAGGFDSQGAGFAVKTDGSVVAWGRPARIDTYWDNWAHYDYDTGTYIGDWVTNTNGWDTVATMPNDLSDIVKVAVGAECAVALKADGSVVSWGRISQWRDLYDEDGNWTNQLFIAEGYPVYEAPDRLDDVVDVAAGSFFLMTLKADGTVVVWNDGSPSYGECDVPDGLSDVIALAAAKVNWNRACFALKSDGTIAQWGDRQNNSGMGGMTAADAVALDAGQYHVVALAADGSVEVWQTWNNYGVCDVPSSVQGNAFAVAAGGYHCTALLPDTDGDTVPDAEEVLLGRDPDVWEDWHRAPISGIVSVGGGFSPKGALVCVFDASGRLVARTRAGADGRYSTPDLIPANYYVSVELDGAADDWAGGALPAADGGFDPAPGTGWTRGAPAPVAVAAGAPALDFRLDPGQAGAWARAKAVSEDASDPTAEPESVALPDGSTVYLDLWPTEPDENGVFPLGEVAASHSFFDGTALLPHIVSVKSPDGEQTPRPDVKVVGKEGYIVPASPTFSTASGSVRVTTDPSGAGVWIDRADEPVGTTPVTVGNLASGGDREHVLLLDKPGYLRPRPIYFAVSPGETTHISVPLEPDTSPAMCVAVSSAVPGMRIYLDYLPMEEITPAEIGGMDPASHAGDLWFSASHSILLRSPLLSPFAPRAVPEWETDPATELPVVPESTPVLAIDAPNTWEWDWGTVVLTEADKPDFSAPGAFEVSSAVGDGVLPPALPEGTTIIRIVVSNPVLGAYYTPFVARSFDETFAAWSDSVRATGNDRELVFEILCPQEDTSKFVRVVVSVDPFEEGDALPDETVTP